jgi:hypothetical protein
VLSNYLFFAEQFIYFLLWYFCSLCLNGIWFSTILEEKNTLHCISYYIRQFYLLCIHYIIWLLKVQLYLAANPIHSHTYNIMNNFYQPKVQVNVKKQKISSTGYVNKWKHELIMFFHMWPNRLKKKLIFG